MKKNKKKFHKPLLSTEQPFSSSPESHLSALNWNRKWVFCSCYPLIWGDSPNIYRREKSDPVWPYSPVDYFPNWNCSEWWSNWWCYCLFASNYCHTHLYSLFRYKGADPLYKFYSNFLIFFWVFTLRTEFSHNCEHNNFAQMKWL